MAETSLPAGADHRQPRLYSIGHSNHPVEVFLGLLVRHRIETVVDTRSQPRSRWASQYDKAVLEETLRERGFRYLFLGRELGGRPEGAEYYDPEGRVLYDRVAASRRFASGMERLLGLSGRTALLCSEEDPAVCHRFLLIARVLRERGMPVEHIRGDGSVQTDEEVLAVESDGQMSLFDAPEERPWRSIRSVSPAELPRTSSRP